MTFVCSWVGWGRSIKNQLRLAEAPHELTLYLILGTLLTVCKAPWNVSDMSTLIISVRMHLFILTYKMQMWTWFSFDAPSLSYKLNPMLCCKNTNHSCSFYYHRHLSFQRLKRKWWPFTGPDFSRRRLSLVSALNMECILSVLFSLLYRFRNNRMVRVSAPPKSAILSSPRSPRPEPQGQNSRAGCRQNGRNHFERMFTILHPSQRKPFSKQRSSH